MKLIIRLLALAISAMALSYTVNAAPAEQGSSKTQLELCGETGDYLFALCAASTCKDTGKRIAVNTPRGGKRWFKEVSCTCPVVNTNASTTSTDPMVQAAYPSGLPAIANVGGGNMRGSCAYPDSAAGPAGGIWSLYSTVTSFPQQTSLYGTQWQTQDAKWNHCAASLNQGREFTNCFSFKCGTPRMENGTLVSDCSCPKGEDVFSVLPTKPNKSFFTDAGGNASTDAEKEQYCMSHPVGGF